jgi:hypothetical protein
MQARPSRPPVHWLAEDPGALPPPAAGREGQGVILCLLLSLVLMGGLVAAQGIRLLAPELRRIEGAFTAGAEAAILPPDHSPDESP